MFRRILLLSCVLVFVAVQGCDNECCSVTPETRYAHIELYPGSVSFMAVQAGPLPAPKNVFLFNSGSTCLGWKATSSESWLLCSPDSGFTGTCGETDTLHVAVNSTDLDMGTHKGSIYVHSNDADNDPGRIEVTYSVVSLSDIFVIRDAWWTDTVDEDGDSCIESARLTWDADVTDGSTREVSAQVFYRQECSAEWVHYYTTSCWTISGEDDDDTYFVTVDNLPRYGYEFSIVLYQCGGPDRVAERDNEDDGDLDGRCFESLVTYTIYDAWWDGEKDSDGDGCRDSGMLAWDADVDEGLTRSVQAHVYYRPVGEGQWTYFASTACYDITGKSRDDAYYVTVEGLDPGRYEFIIDLFECQGNGKAAERSFEHDADLADQCFDEYVPPATGYRIRDAWWSSGVDADGDGYYESRTLVWDPDVDEGTVGEAVSMVVYIDDVALYYGGTECTGIDGVSQGDTCSLEISGIGPGCFHFGILLFECDDMDNEVARRIFSQDDDLWEQCFEPGDQVSMPSNVSIPPPLSWRRPASEGIAPLNPYGGIKEAGTESDNAGDIREGTGRPAPGRD